MRKFCALFFLIYAVVSAATVSPRDFLASAFTDTALLMHEKNADEALRHEGVSLFDNMEFSVRNEAFDFSKQRYSLSVNIPGFGEIRRGRTLSKVMLRHVEAGTDLLLSKALRQRYDLLITSLELADQGAIVDSLGMVAEDRVVVLGKRRDHPDFVLEDLIRAEQDLTASRLDRMDIFAESARLALHLEETGFGKTVLFDTSGLLSVDSIVTRVSRRIFQPDSNSAELRAVRAELALSEARRALEKAEDRTLVKKVSVSYDQSTMDDERARQSAGKTWNTGKAFLCEVTFAIPVVSSHGSDGVRRSIGIMKDRESCMKLERDLRRQITRDVADLSELANRYCTLRDREQLVDVESSLKKYLLIPGVDPLTVLSIKEQVLKNRLRMSRIRFDVLRNYVNVLDMCGELAAFPFVNHLSKTTEPLR